MLYINLIYLILLCHLANQNSIWISTCALGKVIPLDVGSGHVRFPSKFAVTWISWIFWICMKEGLYVS